VGRAGTWVEPICTALEGVRRERGRVEWGGAWRRGFVVRLLAYMSTYDTAPRSSNAGRFWVGRFIIIAREGLSRNIS